MFSCCSAIIQLLFDFFQQVLRLETNIDRQARHDCHQPSLLGDGDKRSEIVCGEEKNIWAD
jgi:hypothetical protein